MTDDYTDPPDMPEDERMTAIEFKAVREWLGVTAEWLADYLGVVLRTIRRWESGTTPIPDGVRLEIEGLEAATGQVVTNAINRLRDDRDPGVVTYRSDEDFRSSQPEAIARTVQDGTVVRWPASWHRRVTMRIAQEVPGLVIVEADGQ
jgi:hypothetical protein